MSSAPVCRDRSHVESAAVSQLTVAAWVNATFNRQTHKHTHPSCLNNCVFFLFSAAQGTIQNCEQSWRPCLSVYTPTRQVRSEYFTSLTLTISAEWHSLPVQVFQAAVTDAADHVLGGNDIIGECPGQKFQVSRLLLHLNSALGPASDVLLDPYLLCWEELIKYDIPKAVTIRDVPVQCC